MPERVPISKRLDDFLFGGDVRRRISTGVIVGLTVAVVVGIVSLVRSCGEEPQTVVVSTPGGTRTVVATPKSRGDEISQRDYWINPPELFSPVPDAIDTSVGDRRVTMSALDGFRADVEAAAPRELVDGATFYEGEPFFIVGRVIDTFSRNSEFGLGREIVIVGKDDSAAAVIGASSDAISACCYRRGDVVYAIVMLAAVGDARFGDEDAKRTAYLVTDNSDAVIDSVFFPIAPDVIGSRAIRLLALEARDQR